MKHPKRQIAAYTFAIWLLGSLAPAHAEDKTQAVPDSEKAEQESPVKAWLQLQSSGEAASAQAQPLSGPVMDRVHERYLKSFTHPVPPYFEHVQPINY
jgi:hypothetical protein